MKNFFSEILGLMVNHLFHETTVRVITASVLPENHASAAGLKKNGFHCAARSVPENRGHALPTKADKWPRTHSVHPFPYPFHADNK